MSPFHRVRPVLTFPTSLPAAILFAWMSFLALSGGVQLLANDWTYWRGPFYNGHSNETGLIDSWKPEGGEGSHILWQREDLGGRSTPVVMNGRLYTLVRAEPGTEREGERVVCVDAKTGKDLWENRFNVWLSDVPDTRVGWSSVVADPETGNVYALGVCGYFLCIDGATGKTKWSVPLHEHLGFLSTYGGRTNFPVVFEDYVIVSGVIIGWGEMARPCHRVIAFDKRTGEIAWYSGTKQLPEDTTYSAPALTVLKGRAAFVFGAGDGALWAFEPRTGRPIWSFQLSRRGINTGPTVDGDRVFGCHSEENPFGTAMGAVAAIDGSLEGDITESGERWRYEEIMAGRSCPLVVDDKLYIFDDRAKLFVLHKTTGKMIGRRIALGSAMRATPLYADGKIYCFTNSEQWAILKPDDKRGAKIVSRGRLMRGDEVYASPIVSDGTLFIQTFGRRYARRDPGKTRSQAPGAGLPIEDKGTAEAKPAHLQLVPVELLLRPGEEHTFRTRLFDDRGRFLREVKAELTVDGAATVQGNRLTIRPDAPLSAVTVTAKADGLIAQARVRVVPPLPWKFDFEDIPLTGPGRLGEPPLPWVGCRYRHVIREMDGNKVMVKVTTIPKGTRSRGWFGPSDLHDYTLEADVRGAIREGLLPDIGLIAQGYTIAMMGVNQQLQIRSWDAQSRMSNTIPFAWKPDTWYTLKLRAENHDGSTRLYGKVWPRGTSEPAEWTIEATDPAPVVQGSPGLFGNATPAEIYLDNIRVYPNDVQ